jgi:crotonobetainyl-CoA:carnitine CoA-transferase CaiB-like acyl-CoA transferase
VARVHEARTDRKRAALRPDPGGGVGVFGAGPFATKLMAELAMQVIKLEAPEGDGMRHYHPQVNGTAYPFHLYNANRHSLCVDLKKPEDVARARAVLAKADVYLENLGPGVVDRLGLGYKDVRNVNPGLVYCSVSGFGKTGPYSGNRAYDTVIQAMSGMMSVTGLEGPLKIGVSTADLLGPTFACASVLAALHHRNRGGAGQRIDVSMHDVCSATTQALWPLVWGAERRRGWEMPIRSMCLTAYILRRTASFSWGWRLTSSGAPLRGC